MLCVVRELVHCACEMAGRAPADHVTFGEFAVLATELRELYRRQRSVCCIQCPPRHHYAAVIIGRITGLACLSVCLSVSMLNLHSAVSVLRAVNDYGR